MPRINHFKISNCITLISFLLFYFYYPLVCVGYDTNSVMVLPSEYLGSTCGTGENARFLHNGWDACNGGLLTIDLIKKRAITSLKVAGSRDSESVLPEFEVDYSVDNIDFWRLGVSFKI